MIDLDSNNTETNSINIQSKVVRIFDYSYRGNYIAFLNPMTNKINVRNFKMSDESGILEKNGSIVINNNGKPICLAIDWVHDLIYWIDIKSSTINVVNIMKPESPLLLINLGEDKVTQLVINPMKTALIWVKNGDSPAVMQSFQDGSNQNVLYSAKAASHITIDFETERYYFIVKSYEALYSIDFQGINEQIHIYSSFLTIVNDMSLLNDDLYFTIDEALVRMRGLYINLKPLDLVLISSKFNDSVHNFNFSSRTPKLFRQEIYGVKLIDPSIQPNFTNKCESANCPYLCLPSGNVVGFRCICPTDSSFNPNYCEVHKQNLVVRTTTERRTFRTLQTESLTTTPIIIPYWTGIPTMRRTNLYNNLIHSENPMRTSNPEERIGRQLYTESSVKNSEGSNHMKGNEGHLNIQLMFGFMMVAFFVLSLIMTALIVLNFRFEFDFFR